MARPKAPLPPVDPRLAGLLQIAADLRELPRQDFKARLKADLQGRAAAAAITVKRIPTGYHSATPCLVVSDPPGAIAFYQRAFDATEVMRLTDPSGNVMHAEIQIGDSRIALAPEAPAWGNRSPQTLGGSPVIVQLHVEDVDALSARAVAAGAKVLIPVADQFYGDRAGRLADPFGHVWIVSTHKEDVSVEEMHRRTAAWTKEEEGREAVNFRVEPVLPVRGASKLIEFLKEAFDAEATSCHTRPDGSIAHAEIRIGDALLSTADSEMVASGPMPTAIHLYVPNADAVYARALRAGATSTHAPVDQPYGDREGSVQDPFGNHWYIATHQADVSDRPAAYIPEGLHSVTSYLHPRGAPQLIDFLKHAFGAREAFRHQAPDGTVVHAKIKIGESMVEMGEAHGPYQPMPTVYHLYVNDTDAVYRRALAAGATSLGEPANQPWGYRNAGVLDPGGNQWWINAPIAAAAPVSDEQPAAQHAATALHTVTPFLHVRNVGKTVDFLKEAFGAELTLFERGGDPPHDHAQVRIGDSVVMLGETIPGYDPTSSAFYLNVADVDAAYARALHAGATAKQPPTDMPWGDRLAQVKDPLGNSWFIATPIDDKR